jgi:tetratricopeptide (TPR) repeat protein
MSMSDPQQQNFLEIGIRYAREGQKDLAAKALAQAVQADPGSPQAWYWLGQVIDDPEKKAYCLKKAKELSKPVLPPQSPAPQPVKPSAFLMEETPAAYSPKHQRLPASMPPLPIEKPASVRPLPKSHAASSPSANKVPEEEKPRFRVETLLIVILIVMIVALIPFGYRYFTHRSNSTLPFGPTYTLPPSQVPSPTATLTITPIPTNTATPIPTATKDLQTRMQSVQVEMDTANSEIDSGDYPNAILDLNHIIERIPDYARAYYLRGYSYFKSKDNLNDEGVYLDDLQKAINDFNIAISLDPTAYKYFQFRSYSIEDYGNELISTADKNAMLEAAMDDINTAKNLYAPKVDVSIEISIAEINNYMGNCKEALSHLNEVAAMQDLTDDQVENIKEDQMRSYLCLGNSQKGLEVFHSLRDCDSECYVYNDSLLLYESGNISEALNVLNKSIENSPTYGGGRYYVRALIEVDNGEYDKAYEDLYYGAGNTWGRNGLYWLLQALISYNNEETDYGDYYMNFAAISADPLLGPKINQRIQEEMKKHDIKIIEYTPDPLTIRTPMVTPRPGEATPTFMPTLDPSLLSTLEGPVS